MWTDLTRYVKDTCQLGKPILVWCLHGIRSCRKGVHTTNQIIQTTQRKGQANVKEHNLHCGLSGTGKGNGKETPHRNVYHFIDGLSYFGNINMVVNVKKIYTFVIPPSELQLLFHNNTSSTPTMVVAQNAECRKVRADWKIRTQSSLEVYAAICITQMLSYSHAKMWFMMLQLWQLQSRLKITTN